MKKLFVALLALSAVNAYANVATYYGDRFHGRKTANGEVFNQNAMTCASNKHKFGAHLKVTNPKNGKSVVCRVNDRGGFGKHGVSVDLSKAAFAKIAPLGQGRVRVAIEPISQWQDGQNLQDARVQDEQIAQKITQVLSQVEPLVITQTSVITLASNTSEN